MTHRGVAVHDRDCARRGGEGFRAHDHEGIVEGHHLAATYAPSGMHVSVAVRTATHRTRLECLCVTGRLHQLPHQGGLSPGLEALVVLTAVGLRRVLKKDIAYDARTRTHLSLNKDAPFPRPVAPSTAGFVAVMQAADLGNGDHVSRGPASHGAGRHRAFRPNVNALDSSLSAPLRAMDSVSRVTLRFDLKISPCSKTHPANSDALRFSSCRPERTV